jgi:dUTP pyrophosphatase
MKSRLVLLTRLTKLKLKLKKMLQVKFKKISDNTIVPSRGSLDAACYDVYAHSIVHKDDGKVVVGLGFKTEIPVGYKAVLVPRSNLTKHHWVMNNSIGIIDSDYRGEWMCVFTAIKEGQDFPYSVGDRVAQFYLDEVYNIAFLEVKALSDTNRGEGGFGSTGLK